MEQNPNCQAETEQSQDAVTLKPWMTPTVEELPISETENGTGFATESFSGNS